MTSLSVRSLWPAVFAFVFFAIALSAQSAGLAASSNSPKFTDDDYLWLEEIESQEVDEWIEKRNREVQEKLAGDARYEGFYKRTLALQSDSERPSPISDYHFNSGYVYKIRQDVDHPRGILLRKSADKLGFSEAWEPLLDVDQLAAEEGKNWYFKPSMFKFSPDGGRLLIALSDGGADAVSLREFDLELSQFVSKNAFKTPARLVFVEWLSEDRLLIVTALSEAEVTTSGYPRVARIWERGNPLDDASVLASADKDDVMLGLSSIHGFETQTLILTTARSFMDASYSIVDSSGSTYPANIPSFLGIMPVYFSTTLNKKLFVVMPVDWSSENHRFDAGSIVAFDLGKTPVSTENSTAALDPSLIFNPTEGASVNPLGGIVAVDGAIYLNVLDNVVSRLYRVDESRDGAWKSTEVTLPGKGTVSLPAVSDASMDVLLFHFEDLVTAPSEYLLKGDSQPVKIGGSLQVLSRSEYTIEQLFASADDGVKIPYFVAYRGSKEELSGKAVLVYGYGGFGASMTQSSAMTYLGFLHPLWLEQGGVFVLANVRGGGEYGPKWHSVAVRENRQRVYDDFYAVTEDLAARGIGKPGKYGFVGVSNGGLTAGVLATQRPDLFGGVVSLVPVLDMARFHKLLAGASFMEEYGNPDIPAERNALLAYSPLQNVTPDRSISPMLLMTSTRDDRVHPAHARKMAKKMRDMGHEALFYEAREGGHAMAVDDEGRAENTVKQLVFLLQTLVDQ